MMASLRIVSLVFAAVPPLQASNPCVAVTKLFPSEENGQERIDACLESNANKLGKKIEACVDTLVLSLRDRNASITHQELQVRPRSFLGCWVAQ